MKKLIFVILSFVLVGCSAKWHVNRAVKKDPSIQSLVEYTDTVQFTRFVEDTVYNSDSTFYIERKEFHYDTIIKIQYKKYDFTDLKTWFEIQQEEKTKRKQIKNDRKENQTEIRQENKTDRTEIRQDAKTERGRSWWWLWLSIGIVATLVLRRVFNKTMDNLKF